MNEQLRSMHRTKSFSLYAFIIAVLVHLIVVLMIALIDKVIPVPPPAPKEQEEESRFKVSLKEMPNVEQEALVKNTIPKITPARPIPKGEQLDKPTPIQPPKQKPVPVQTVSKPQESAPVKESSAIAPEPKKAFERHVAKEVATIERQPQPKKEQGAYEFLSKADPSAKDSLRQTTQLTDSIQKLYGDQFSELSEGEQKYILDNQEVMRRITQTVLNRYGRTRIPDNLRADETNTIEFYLHPDGSISGIHFLKKSRFAILDDTTKETIEIAYSQYPRPTQKTRIRYRVWYNLQ